ncbi:MAG: hypothetical protein QXN59_01050 [Candidatus Micrarchaeaceae archaeon]
MQKSVSKSNRKIGKAYRKKQKLPKLKAAHRKRLKAQRRKNRLS